MSAFVLAIAMSLGVLVGFYGITANAVIADATSTSYYSSITATSGTALLGQLHDLITKTHKTYTSYTDCKTPATVLKTDPGKASNMICDFYTQEDISSKWDGNSAGTWNREHVWCQSLSNGLWGTSGGGSDLHHLRPSEVRLNGTRGNHTFGEANGGTPAYYKDTNGNNKYVGGYVSGDTFEPLDKVKGDVARIVLYVYTHYNTYSNVNGTTNGSGGASFGTLKFTHIMTPNNESEAIKLLLEWNKSDPVDEIEITRNEAVYAIQGNRNPFIDNESYADAIWGGGSTTPGGDTTPELTSLAITPSTLNLTAGKTGNLSVTATPATASKSVTWSTSDSSVATVSNGVVTAKAEGTATITATSTVKPSVKATATVKVTASGTTTPPSPPTPPPPTDDSFTIDIGSFSNLGGYSFHDWTEGGVSGIAYMYGSTSKMQFNSSKSSHYLASTTPTSAPIKEITVKLQSDSKDWQLLTSTSAYEEITNGNPKSGNDQGTKAVTTGGTTWTVDGEDTYFALVYQGTGVCYIDSITVTLAGNSDVGGGGGGDNGDDDKKDDDNLGGDVGGGDVTESENVKKFKQAVAGIVTDGTLAERFTSLNNAIRAYSLLTSEEKAQLTEEIALLSDAIDEYNELVRLYNGDSSVANDAATGGAK